MRGVVDPFPANIDLEMSPAAAVGVGHHVDLHLVKAALFDLEMRGVNFPEVGHRRIEVCGIEDKLLVQRAKHMKWTHQQVQQEQTRAGTRIRTCACNTSQCVAGKCLLCAVPALRHLLGPRR